MELDCATRRGGHLSLQELVDEYLLRGGRRCFVVVNNHGVPGLTMPHDERRSIARLIANQRAKRDAPSRSDADRCPDTLAIQALNLMSREGIDQLPILSDGRLDGVFSLVVTSYAY